MDQARSRQRKTIEALLDGYGSLSVPQLLMTMSADFHHQVLPESLGMAARNRESFAQHAAGIFSIFDEFRMVPKSIVLDGPENMAMVHARMQGILKGGAGDWINECVMMIQLSTDGTQVLKVTEFVDSAKALEMARKHAPDDFGVNYRGMDGGRQKRGDGHVMVGSKSINLLFGLGITQVFLVIILLYLTGGVLF
ncbi:hypothetical protein GGS26DRAFT_483430 [Hypomontagnella submonticulosa]|nr:hypothetical protein GGS26DRAFT_483430 [Hypomontagnella submonticulosa]